MASTLLLLGMSLALVLPAGAVLPTLTARMDPLVPRATDIDVFSVCPLTTEPAKVSSYVSCYSSQYMSLGACTVKANEESCMCSVVSQLVSSCVPIVCPSDVGPVLISAVGCAGGPGATMTGTGTYVSGGSKTGTSYTTAKATGTGVKNSTATGKTTGKTTGTVLGTDSTSLPTDTDTDTDTRSATRTGSGSATGAGSGAGAKTTSSSSAFAGEVVIPVAGSFLAGVLGLLAFLL